MLFFVIDIFCLIKWMQYKGKLEEAVVRKETEEVIAFYKKKEKFYCLWFAWCMIINLFSFLFSF